MSVGAIGYGIRRILRTASYPSTWGASATARTLIRIGDRVGDRAGKP